MAHKGKNGPFRRLFIVCFTLLLALGIFVSGMILLWIATLKIPNLSSFDERKVTQSTKLYDRTGETLLYDVHENIKRSIVPFDEISKNAKNATVAIEDADFYEHGGIRVSSIIRALLANLATHSFSQGGSTITQQVVKNALLSGEKTISRKLKEWILAIKLEKSLSKDQILSIYLNEIPYGGNVYGIEEASQAFFGKKAKDLTLAEAAYIASLPQAPTYFSPYGNHRTELDARKNLVLRKMHEKGFITDAEYTSASKEKVDFKPVENIGIKAPHFVIYIKQYLIDKYGEKAVEEDGLKVTTTLDYKLQEKAQELAQTFALDNKVKFNAENIGLVAIDPKTGGILAMVGSRNYFDRAIDGNFNITLAHRQPGSSFKPIVYSEAFIKGYTPDTVLFDVPTVFETTCTPEGKPLNPKSTAACYKPNDFDDKFRGPMKLRDALAQSINVPAVKLLYLAGLKDSLNLAKDMGITSLTNTDQYGLTLVLGGGEVSLLELTGAYGVLANEGRRNPSVGILKVEDRYGNILEQYEDRSVEVLPRNVTLQISDILSDDTARTPTYGVHSPLYFEGRDVAAKTGTTNDYRDVWILGYTPNVVIGAWAGNNNNTPMVRKFAGLIIAPFWHAVMEEALKNLPEEHFKAPEQSDTANLKPVMQGIWQGGQSYVVDKYSGKLATAYTPDEAKETRVVQNVHSILYWVDKNNPLGPPALHPEQDPQFNLWEYGVRKWAEEHGYSDQTTNVIPTQVDDLHRPEFAPVLSLTGLDQGKTYGKNEKITVSVTNTGRYPLTRVDLFINNTLFGSIRQAPFVFSFIPTDLEGITPSNDMHFVGYDASSQKAELLTTLKVSP